MQARRLAVLLPWIAAVAVYGCGGDSDPIPPTADPFDPGPPVLPATDSVDGWKQQAVYTIVARSFQDSDGDGIGDYQGIIDRLDYIAANGAGVLLIDLPAETSFGDGARTASNLTAAAVALGGDQAFDNLVAATHARGLKLAVTQYLNHVDRTHPWFEAAVVSGAVERGYFHFSATPATSCADIAADVPDPYGTTRWTFSADHGAFYFHRFGPDAPDLNWTHPDVQDALLAAVTTWLERGADGVYLPDAYAWVEDFANGRCDDTTASRNLLARVREVAEARNAFVWASEHSAQRGPHDDAARTAAYIGDGPGGARADAVVATGLGDRLADALSGAIGSAGLGQLIDELAAATATRDGVVIWPTGHWDMPRISTALANDFRAYRAAMAFLATGPFVPWLYYGDELAVGNGSEVINDTRDKSAAPLPWTTEPPLHGFSTTTPFLALPLESDTRNVAAAENDAGSTLGTWRRLLAWRYRLAPLHRGNFIRAALTDDTTGEAPAEAVAWVRRSDNEAVLVVHNTGAQPKTLTVDAGATGWPRGRLRDLNNPERAEIAYVGNAQPSVQLTLERAGTALLVLLGTGGAAP